MLTTAHDVVDVVDLEGDVVGEGHGSRLDRQVVMDLAAACEGDDAGHLVADLEPEHVGEEPQRRRLVGCAVDDVGEVRRRHGFGGEHALRGNVVALVDAGPVERVRRRRGGVGIGLGDLDEQAGDRLGEHETRVGRLDDRAEAAALDPAGDAAEVVRIIGADAEPVERSRPRWHQFELFAAITSRQHAVARQTEVVEERRGRDHVRDAERDRGQAMKGHGWTN